MLLNPVSNPSLSDSKDHENILHKKVQLRPMAHSHTFDFIPSFIIILSIAPLKIVAFNIVYISLKPSK